MGSSRPGLVGRGPRRLAVDGARHHQHQHVLVAVRRHAGPTFAGWRLRPVRARPQYATQSPPAISKPHGPQAIRSPDSCWRPANRRPDAHSHATSTITSSFPVASGCSTTSAAQRARRSSSFSPSIRTAAGSPPAQRASLVVVRFRPRRAAWRHRRDRPWRDRRWSPGRSDAAAG